MKASDTDTSGLKGFLIDLDYAQQHHGNSNFDNKQVNCITGTAPFMALELLLKNNRCHTWRHDLESFFYVLIWLCTDNPNKELGSWVHALLEPPHAKAKLVDIQWSFEDVLEKFYLQFEPLKDLVRELGKILFFQPSTTDQQFDYTTPSYDDAKAKIYTNILHAFDDCISALDTGCD